MLQIRFDTEKKYNQLKEVFLFYDCLKDMNDYHVYTSRKSSMNSNYSISDEMDPFHSKQGLFVDHSPKKTNQLTRSLSLSKGTNQDRKISAEVNFGNNVLTDFSKKLTHDFSKKPDRVEQIVENKETSEKEKEEENLQNDPPKESPRGTNSSREKVTNAHDREIEGQILETKENVKRNSRETRPVEVESTENVPQVPLKKYQENLKRVQKCEQIISLSPKLIIESSENRLAPSIGKITLKKKKRRSDRVGLALANGLRPILTQLTDQFSLSRHSLASSQESFATLAASIGLAEKRLRYQPKFLFSRQSSNEIPFSFFAILKWFLFLKMLLIILNQQVNSFSDFKLKVLLGVFVLVVLAEHAMGHLRTFVNRFLDRNPNYLEFKSRVREEWNFNRLFKLGSEQKPKNPREYRFGPKFKHHSQEIRLKNMCEMSFLVKNEFITKNLEPAMKIIKGADQGVDIKTGYRNSELMVKSPETGNFEYLEGRTEDRLVNPLGTRVSSGEGLSGGFNPRKDVIYFMFVRRPNSDKPSSSGESVSASQVDFRVEKIFKIKFKKDSLKVEYFGDIDSKIVNLIQKFRMDYEHFIRGGFLQKCLEKANDSEHDENQSTLSEDSEKGKLKEPAKVTNEPIEQVQQNKPVPTETHVEEQPEKEEPPVENLEKESPPEEPTQEEPRESVPLTEEARLKRECQALVAEINKPQFNFDIAGEYETKRELLIAKRFLEVVKTYWEYYAEEGQWKVSDKHKEYTAWARSDGRFIVRKAEIQSKIDLDLFEKTMKNFKLVPKWNPLLGSH